MAENGKLKLADELAAQETYVGFQGLLQIIERLRAGYYDEFSDDSPLATPEMELVRDLRNVAGNTDESTRRSLQYYIQRVINGVYDATEEESRRWAERQTDETRDLTDLLREIEG